ncbi:hypothetical protein [Paenarthrobacter sp. C1]|uniref:hypothetical protein n=1 Tax=Paenarthrobacter sp. C1 TaxID=3400220 RepID=UPI003BF5EB6C
MAGEYLKVVTPPIAERPSVLVEQGGRWYMGELRQWMQLHDQSWKAQVQWHREPGSTFISDFPADRVVEHTAETDVRLPEGERYWPDGPDAPPRSPHSLRS